MKLLRQLIKEALLLEAKENAEFLIKLNYDKLKKKNPEKNPKELLAKARDLPDDNPNVAFDYFTRNVIQRINALPAREGGYDRRFIKWLAEEIKFRDFFLFDSDIYDWYLGDENAKTILNTLDYKQAHKKSREWHESLTTKEFGTSVKEKANETIALEGGYKLKELKSKTLMRSVGVSMGICINQGYYTDAMSDGAMRFFTLFDPNDIPVVTVNVYTETNEVQQIKGINNSIPKEQHRNLIKQWLRTTNFDITKSDDFFNILSKEEVLEKLHKEKEENIKNFFDLTFYKILHSFDFNLSNKDRMKIALGIAFSCCPVMYDDTEEVIHLLLIGRDWLQGKASDKELMNAYNRISRLYSSSFESNARQLYAAKLALSNDIISIGSLCDRADDARKLRIPEETIVKAIETEIGMPLHDFLFDRIKE